MKNKFRYAFVAHNSGHDFSGLKDLCSAIKFCSDGYESEEELTTSMENVLQDFDPGQDVLVPVGNVSSNLLMGMIVSRMLSEPSSQTIRPFPPTVIVHVAMYRDKHYQVREISIGQKGVSFNVEWQLSS